MRNLSQERLDATGQKPGQDCTDPLLTCNACDYRCMNPQDPRGYCPACAEEADAEEGGRHA